MQDLIMAGYIELAGDIVDKAVNDRAKRPLDDCYWIDDGDEMGCGENYLRCVKNFFKTDWFEGLCDLSGKDAFAIRRNYDFIGWAEGNTEAKC